MASPVPSAHRSLHSSLKVCTTCEAPMRGHSRVDRKFVCPPREKLNETLQLLWEEGHHDFVLSIARKLQLSFSPSLQTPPSTPSISSYAADRIRQRKATPGANVDKGPEETNPIRREESKSSMTSSLRRMISTVIDDRTSQRSPSPSRSITSSVDIPTVAPESLPAVGPWNAERRRDWSVPADLGDMPQSDRGSLVPTLLIGSDGQTIREGSRAEAHFRAQAALEARIQRQRDQQGMMQEIPHEDFSAELSVIHFDKTKNDDEHYEGSGFLRVLRSVMASPAIIALPVRPEDVPRVQETAARQGLFTSVLEVVPKTPKGTSRALPQALRNSLIRRGSVKSVDSAEDDRPIVVIGRDQVTTRRYVEMAQRGAIPGAVTTDRDILNTPRLVTLNQLIFISVLTVFLAWAVLYTVQR